MPSPTAAELAAAMRAQREAEAADRLRTLLGVDEPCEKCVFIPTPGGKRMCGGAE